MTIFDAIESNVRSYCRSFPAIFSRAQGAILTDESGREFIDFWAGAGVLNYGHNNPRFKRALLQYIEDDGISHALDLSTVAKRRFLERFAATILAPRDMHYKVQFPGPTGTNAIEAALKLARKVTGRTNVLCFTNAYHGMTLGALAVTGNSDKRQGAGLPLGNVTRLPFDGYLGAGFDTLDLLVAMIDDASSGIDLPAAVLLETIQAEGGVRVASTPWLRRLEAIARRHDILVIVDEVQVGCGRTGPFFSFEEAGMHPDIICLSKSISGFGLPMALVLIRPDLDIWKPGEHNGTFRGNNLAFVTGAEALHYWEDDELSKSVAHKADLVRRRLGELAGFWPAHEAEVRGRGLIQGLVCHDDGLAERISRLAFERGLVVETVGPRSEVLKILPPLTISDEALEKGLAILGDSIQEARGTAEGRSAA
jgi:diaminobutyrate-2-oxoglutarate transaminase